MNKYLKCMLIGLLITVGLSAAQLPQPINENEWTEHIVSMQLNSAITQQTLYDGTRPDILWQQYAIEVDWCNKWAEGVGQALFYAKVTGKRPVVLLLTKPGNNWKDDKEFVSRALIASPQGTVVWWYDCDSNDWIQGMEP